MSQIYSELRRLLSVVLPFFALIYFDRAQCLSFIRPQAAAEKDWTGSSSTPSFEGFLNGTIGSQVGGKLSNFLAFASDVTCALRIMFVVISWFRMLFILIILYWSYLTSWSL